jgi:hypothetical protein
MNAWMLLWKVVLVAGLAVFAGIAVWVTIAGVGDIKRLLRKIREARDDHAEDQEEE